MRLFRNVAPVGALSDLRLFLKTRQRHDWWFLLLALVVTAAILWGFVKDSQFEKPYRREIIYVQSWPLNRSDEDIRAQQAIDLPKEQARKAEREAREKKRRDEFKKIDDALSNWGL